VDDFDVRKLAPPRRESTQKCHRSGTTALHVNALARFDQTGGIRCRYTFSLSLERPILGCQV
jgi:hypothetical protein